MLIGPMNRLMPVRRGFSAVGAALTQERRPRPISSMDGPCRVLTTETINPHLVRAQYAVRGELAIRAEELKEQLNNNPESLPFNKIVFCNIGNPQQLGQKPLTYFRQILALVEWPQMLEQGIDLSSIFPADVIERARRITKSIGSVGAYTHSQGIPAVREAVATFIERRDGHPTSLKNIFLTNGASDAVTRVLETIITSEKIGVMVSIPQYPLYSAAISLLNGTSVPYHLCEESDWSLPVAELERSIKQAKLEGITVRALSIINPGNPTGHCYTETTLREIISFCQRHHLVLLSDEVYQMNTYGHKPFISARKVAIEMGTTDGNIEIISFHSISKGLIGECGHRGGYFECHNIDPPVLDQFYKLSSICLCANVPGQIMMSLMVDPPRPDEPSYTHHFQEMADIWESLRGRAEKMQIALSKMTNVTCNPASGAMYLFPRITFPERLLKHAQSVGKQPDQVYAMDLLNSTGICVVPGSGFGQRLGTFHIRTTFLPHKSHFDDFISLWGKFHESFMSKWN